MGTGSSFTTFDLLPCCLGAPPNLTKWPTRNPMTKVKKGKASNQKENWCCWDAKSLWQMDKVLLRYWASCSNPSTLMRSPTHASSAERQLAASLFRAPHLPELLSRSGNHATATRTPSKTTERRRSRQLSIRNLLETEKTWDKEMKRNSHTSAKLSKDNYTCGRFYPRCCGCFPLV